MSLAPGASPDFRAGLGQGVQALSRGNAHSGVFEFGDFPVRVQRRVGENVCRRFDIGKGQEHPYLKVSTPHES